MVNAPGDFNQRFQNIYFSMHKSIKNLFVQSASSRYTVTASWCALRVSMPCPQCVVNAHVPFQHSSNGFTNTMLLLQRLCILFNSLLSISFHFWHISSSLSLSILPRLPLTDIYQTTQRQQRIVIGIYISILSGYK